MGSFWAALRTARSGSYFAQSLTSKQKNSRHGISRVFWTGMIFFTSLALLGRQIIRHHKKAKINKEKQRYSTYSPNHYTITPPSSNNSKEKPTIAMPEDRINQFDQLQKESQNNQPKPDQQNLKWQDYTPLSPDKLKELSNLSMFKLGKNKNEAGTYCFKPDSLNKNKGFNLYINNDGVFNEKQEIFLNTNKLNYVDLSLLLNYFNNVFYKDICNIYQILQN